MEIECTAKATTFRDVPQGGCCAFTEGGRTVLAIKIVQHDYSGRPFASCAVIWPGLPDPNQPSAIMPGEALGDRAMVHYPDASIRPSMAAETVATADGAPRGAGQIVLSDGKLFIAVPGARGVLSLVDIAEGEVALRLPANAAATFDAWTVSVPGPDGRETVARFPAPVKRRVPRAAADA
jgi:hypothetical protein